jgi:hypothetical protein
MSFFCSDAATNLPDQSDAIFSMLMHDFIEHKGRVLIANASGKDVLRYLMERGAPDLENRLAKTARPTELLAVLLAVCSRRNASEVVDPFMDQLDHHNCNVYLPDDYRQFAESSISGGVNITFQVGFEGPSGIFTVDDFTRAFAAQCSRRLREKPTWRHPAVNAGAILCSAVFANRVCWFLTEQ